MWTHLALVAAGFAAPQGIRVADEVSAAFAKQEVEGEVDAVRAHLAAKQRLNIRSAAAPAFVAVLRDAGVETIDEVRDVLDFAAADDASMESIVDGAVRLAAKSARSVKAKRMDVREFERLCERVHRDVMSAIGSGRDIQATTAKLHAVLDKVRVGAVGETWDKSTRALVVERFERVGRVDHEQMRALARRLLAAAVQWNDPKLLRKLRKQEAGSPRSIEGVRGDVLYDRETTFGRLVVGGPGPNEYECSQVDVIIDIGGNDTYRGPAGGAGELRQLAVAIDVEGDDRYEAINGGLGSGTFGIGLCIDFAGNDVYRGGERCMGFGAAGVGMFFDLAGDDDVEIGGLGAGAALAGLGVCVDFAGNDKQKAGAESFGCGLGGGVGVFCDLAGDDRREIVADQVDAFGGSRLVSFGFGAGLGVRDELAGGLGVCADVAGNDRYVAGGFAVGVGARGGCGVFRDFAGDDAFECGMASLGAAVDGGVGVFVDDAGADSYRVGPLSLGAAACGAAAWFCDFAGKDAYTADTNSLGAARCAAVAVCLDLDAEDEYVAGDTEFVWPVPEELPGRAAVGLLIDKGGDSDAFRGLGFAAGEPERMIETEAPDGLARRILIDR